MIPSFAKPLVEARSQGMRPANMVLVSDGQHHLHRRFPDNPVVVIDDNARPNQYEWWFLADLEVEIVTEGDAERIEMLVAAVMTGSPGYLRVWRVDTGACTRVWWLGRYWNTPEVIHAIG
jgi:hypothetical protein